MKGYAELAIGVVLLVLMYEKPHFLTEFSNSILGKAVMIIGVGFMAKTYGLVSGLLSALVVLILMEDTKEGLSAKNKKKDKTMTDSQDAMTYKEFKTLEADACHAVIVEHDGKSCQLYKSNKKNKNGTKEKFTNIATQAANVRTSIADIRLVGGSRHRASYENTIGAMKQCNGHTY
jgi:hypothetical protein